MFAEGDIRYRSIDLDSAANQEDDWGGQVRTALESRFSTKTIPQIFVGGEHIGGCTETFDAFKDGTLQRLMEDSGVSYDTSVDFDPYSLLPAWLQPR